MADLIYPADFINQVIEGDCITVMKQIPNNTIDCCITSPPYWRLRDYNIDGQFGLEKTPEEYIQRMVEVFHEVRRVLKDTGTLWLILGDTYAGSGHGYRDYRDFKGLQATNKGTEWMVDLPPADIPKGLKPKDIIGIPWRIALALQQDGWWLRQDIIWAKPNPMPESVTDRCTKSHEYIFLLAKSRKYYFDSDAIAEPATGYDGRKDIIMKGSGKYSNGFAPTQSVQTLHQQGKPHQRWRKRKNDNTDDYGGNDSGYNKLNNPYIRNKRSVWTVNTKPFKGAHFAVFPEELIRPMILAGCPAGGVVFDPFIGSGTTGLMAKKLGRNYLGIELNPEYIRMAEKRISGIESPLF